MNHNLSVSESITIKVSAQKMWEVLTTPSIIKEYLFGTETISDWKTGSPIIFQGEWEGTKYRDKGTILKFEKNKIFQYNYWSNFSGLDDIPENYTRITFELSEKNNITFLALTQDHFVTQIQYEHSAKNWDMVLKTIKKLMEG